MQKVNGPDEVCDDPEEEPEPTSCSEHVSGGRGPGPRAAGASSPCPPLTAHVCPQRAECERLLTAAAFEACVGLVPLAPYVQACERDRCQCALGAACACSTVAEFSRQCSHAGGQPGNWRNATLCRECPARGGRRGATRGGRGGRRARWAGQEPHPLTADAASARGARLSPGGAGARTLARHPRAWHPAACLCPFSQELPGEHGVPGERLALRGHLLSPGDQQPVRGAPHGWLFLPRR